MTTTIETLKEKIRNNKILVLRDFYCYHVSAQTYLNSFEKDSIEIDLENWRYRSSHKTCWAGDPPNIKGYCVESEKNWKELPEEFILEEKSRSSSSGGSRESHTITYYKKGEPPVVIYDYSSDSFACLNCHDEDCDNCPHQYEYGVNILE
jgi:hypothetical protein